jgi:hypothetical protein
LAPDEPTLAEFAPRERRNEIGASIRVTFMGGGGFEYFAGSPNIVVQPMHA